MIVPGTSSHKSHRHQTKRAKKYRKKDGKACGEYLMGKRRDWKKESVNADRY